MKFKRLLVGMSIFSFLYAQQANAFLPALAIPVIAVIQTGAVGAALTDAALIGTAVLGGLILDSKTNFIGNAVNAIKIFAKGQAITANPDIVVSVDPKSIPTDAPPNWAFDSGTGLSFDPSKTVSPSHLTTTSTPANNSNPSISFQGNTYSSASDFCGNYYIGTKGYYTPLDQFLGFWTPSMVQNGVIYCGTIFSFVGSFGSSTDSSVSPVIQGSCPVGSTNTNGNCESGGTAPPGMNLLSSSAPPMWPSDGHCSVVVSNVNGVPSFTGNPQDPDCFTGGNSANAPAPLPPNVSMTGNQIKVNNGPSQTTITLNPDGSVKVISTSPNSAGTATTATTVDLDRPIVGAPGISMPVIGQSTQTFTGTGTQTSSTPITTVGAVDPMTGLPISPSTGSSSPSTDPAVIADLNAIKAAELASKADLDKIADETPAAVPGLPAIPKLYTPVYPNGLKGVWNSHSATLQNTAVFKAIAKFVPNWGGGTCPSFQLNLSLASYANYGNQDLSIPCTVWDIVGVLVMLSALFSARRIIFGG